MKDIEEAVRAERAASIEWKDLDTKTRIAKLKMYEARERLLELTVRLKRGP